MRNAIVVLSGGQDSTTCLFWAKQIKKIGVNCITIDYGQHHVRELEAAKIVAEIAKVESHEVIHVGSILRGTSPLINRSAKLEQYKDHSSLPGGIEKTFVPMRNQLFLTIAFNRAALHESSAIITGVCEEDYGGYPDCRHEFIEAFETTSNIGLYGTDKVTGEMEGDWIDVWTPLMNLTKAESVRLALTLEGCYEALAFSHTSYDGEYPPTGHDHATLLRAKGFEEADVPDPLILRAYIEARMRLPDAPNYRKELMTPYLLRIENFLNSIPHLYRP